MSEISVTTEILRQVVDVPWPSSCLSATGNDVIHRCRIAGIPQISATAETSQQRIATALPPHRCSALAPAGWRGVTAWPAPKAVNGCSAGPLLGSRETLRLWLPVMLLTALRIIGCVRMTAN